MNRLYHFGLRPHTSKTCKTYVGIEWLDYNTVDRVARCIAEWVGYAQSHGGHIRSSRHSGVAVGTVAHGHTPFWFEYKFFGFEMGRGYRNHQVVDKIPRATKSKTANFFHTV